jgi:YkoY family integral membrane protein
VFSQTFDYRDLLVILVLVLLEGVLSIDNALVLGLLARRLPPALRRKALSYGLIGALVFRIIAVVLAGWVLRWHIVLLLGGGYLVYLSLKHLLFTPKRFRGKHGKAKERIEHESASVSAARFWPTVASIELTDIAFALDSILAAIALVADETPAAPGKPHPKMWVVITGGMIGVVLVRAAAAAFIKLRRLSARAADRREAHRGLVVQPARPAAHIRFLQPPERGVLDLLGVDGRVLLRRISSR